MPSTEAHHRPTTPSPDRHIRGGPPVRVHDFLVLNPHPAFTPTLPEAMPTPRSNEPVKRRFRRKP
jgi:hypothetical protein